MSDFDYQPPEHGSPAPEADQTPESGFTSVAIGGKTYRVPVDMAESIEAERNKPTYTPPPQDVEPQHTDSEEFWENPQSYIQSQIQKGIQEGIKKMKVENATHSAEQKFWGDFYQKNPHLKQIDSYLQHLAMQNVEKLKRYNGDTTKMANFIADLGNKELQKFGKTPQTSEVFVEGAAQPTPAVPQPSHSPNKVATMGDVLRKRREGRRKARLGAS